jgi:hypothetical protein
MRSPRKAPKRRFAVLGVVIGLATATIWIGGAQTASAATNCRKVMQDLQVKVINAEANPDVIATTTEQAAITQIVEHTLVIPNASRTLQFGINGIRRFTQRRRFLLPRVMIQGRIRWDRLVDGGTFSLSVCSAATSF